VLLLEFALADRPDPEPVLESDVLRDDVAEVFPSTGEEVMGEAGLLFGALYLPPKSKLGISVAHK
jgi:hypothetical protein